MMVRLPHTRLLTTAYSIYNELHAVESIPRKSEQELVDINNFIYKGELPYTLAATIKYHIGITKL